MKYCTKCGKPNEDENRFCASCGEKFIIFEPKQFNDNVISGDVDMSTVTNIVNNYNGVNPSSKTVDINNFLKLMFISLEDGDWDHANAYCVKVLEQDPENAHAFLGKLMIDLKVKLKEDLDSCNAPFDNNNNYKRAIRFGDEKLISFLQKQAAAVNHIEEQRKAEEARKAEELHKSEEARKVLEVRKVEEVRKQQEWTTFTNTFVFSKLPNSNLYRVTGLKDKTKTSVEIPEFISRIGTRAFLWCSNITNITLADSVETIGDSTFHGCSNLRSVTLSNKLTSIPDGAFSGCSSLTNITIPNSVTSIGSYAFSGCSNLTSITIPDNVTSIGNNAFDGCSNLTSITIPDSVTSFGQYVFMGCHNLTSIALTKDIIHHTELNFCDKLAHIIFNGTVKECTEKFAHNPLFLRKFNGEFICSNGTVKLKA